MIAQAAASARGAAAPLSFTRHGATILTSNKGFEDWGEIFGDDVMAAALVDRLVHHCHIVNIRGNSYRLRQHRDLARLLQQDGATRRQAPTREGATSPQG